MNHCMSAPTQTQSRQSQTRQPPTSTVSGQAPSIDLSAAKPDTLLMLQRTAGNQAVLRLLRSGGIMPKLQVGPVNDRYEQEADRIASQVMRKPVTVQRHHDEEEEHVQTKRSEPVKVSAIQRSVENHGPGCGCGSCVQRKPVAVQRHHEEEEEEQIQTKRSQPVKISAIQRSVEEHGPGCTCPECTQVQRKPAEQIQREAHGPNCTCPQCTQVQRSAPQVKKDGSFEADQNLTNQVRRLEGRGRPLDNTIRREMESRFGADFSGVRIHTDATANRLNRDMSAEAFTYRQHIAFAAGRYNPGTNAGKRLLAHELTHTLQQTGGGVQRKAQHQPSCKCETCAGVQRKASRYARQPVQRKPAVQTTKPTSDVVQRHSSWEHKLIGDLTPNDLSIIGASRDVKDAGEGVTVIAAGQPVSKDTVLHVLEQEIRRLLYFQNNPITTDELEDLSKAQDRLQKEDKQDRIAKAKTTSEQQNAQNTEWQVRLVGIPAKDGSIFGVTYGELNTLADFYGSVKEMKNADPKFLERLIRGVRQSTLKQLVELYAEIKGIKEKKARKELGIKSMKFGKDAIKLGGVVNELKLMGSLPGTKKKGIVGDSSTNYKPTLARNACHFPPESWHAWADNHEKARQKALEAYNASVAGDQEEFQEKFNKAMLYNGFGDHYLQDSYASGHLINKTLIMQWYVEWLDQNPWYWDAYSDKNWRHMQQMAYNQPGLSDPDQYDKLSVDKSANNPYRREARNPQSVLNKGGTWLKQFEGLGLQAPKAFTSSGGDAQTLLTWWQKDIISKKRIRRPRAKKLVTLKNNGPFGKDASKTKAALFDLLKQGIVRPEKYSVRFMQRVHAAKNFDDLGFGWWDTFVLREDFIPKNVKSKTEFDQKFTQDNGKAYEKMGKTVVYNDYVAFMKSSFIQKATNSLHDYFCKKGLDVYAGDKTHVFKIYGDNNMLQKGSAAGLKHSGETARMSQEAIENIAHHGNDKGISTDKIVNRFPDGVRLDNGNTVSLEEWHTGGTLKKLCFDTVFPEMSKFGASQFKNKIAPGVLGRSLGTVTTIKPHGNEVF